MSIRLSSPSKFIIAISTAYFIAAIVPLCAPATLWGISHLYYLDWPQRLAIAAGSLLAALVAIQVRRIPKFNEAATTMLTNFVLPLALLLAFFLFRVKTHYLGDGILRAHEVEQGIKLLPTEPLGHYLNYLCYAISSRLLGWNSIQSTAALSLLAGVAFYFAALHLVKTLFERGEDQVLAFVVLYFSGTALLFCGYVESYSLFPALLTFYAASGIRAVEKRGSVWVPIGCYLLLALFHFQFLYLAPTLLYLAYRQFREGGRLIAAAALLSIAISMAAAATSAIWTGRPTLGIGEFLVDLAPGGGYWLLSAQHLLDILNQFMLTAVAPIVLLAGIVFHFGMNKIFDQPRLLFAVLFVPGAIAFMSLLQPELGYASDWDLFSSAGVVIAIFALTIYSQVENFTLSRPAQVMIAAVAFLSFTSFAAVNSSADLALTRQVDILTVAGEHGAVGFETLGTDLSLEGRKDLAEQMWKRSLEIRPHARVLGNLGQLCLIAQRYDEAESYLTRSIALDSTRAIVFLDLGLTYAWQGRDSIGGAYLRRAVELAPGDPKFHHNLAVFLSQQGNLAEAELFSRNAVSLQPDNANYATTLATFLARRGNTAEAEKFLLQAIAAEPEYANAYINLAAIYRSEGQVDHASQVLKGYLARFPEGPESAKIRQVMEENLK